MLERFIEEVNEIFDDLNLVKLLMKYYQSPLIFNVESTKIECYHTGQLVKTIPFAAPLTIKSYIACHDKLYVVATDMFFFYDLTTNKFTVLDGENRFTSVSFILGLNVLVMNCSNRTEIWDTIENKLIKLVHRGGNKIIDLLANQFLVVIDRYHYGVSIKEEFGIMNCDTGIIKDTGISSLTHKGLVYQNQFVYDLVEDSKIEIYNFQHELLTTINLFVSHYYTIESHYDNFYIGCNKKLYVRGVDNFDIDDVRTIVGIYPDLIYYRDTGGKFIIYNKQEKTKTLVWLPATCISMKY